MVNRRSIASVGLLALNLLLAVPASAALPQIGQASGYDVSYPQCSAAMPLDGSFGVVGVNGGRAWTSNPCVQSEFAWASRRPSAPAYYLNTGNPGPISIHWGGSGPRACSNPSSYNDTGCSYNYGWNAAQQSFLTGVAASSRPAAAGRWWWLDVETSNSWNGNRAANAADIQGAVDFLRAERVAGVGLYSTGYQWGQITGGYPLGGVPNWLAGAGNRLEAMSWCGAARSFSGGRVKLVQYPAGGLDGDVRCY